MRKILQLLRRAHNIYLGFHWVSGSQTREEYIFSMWGFTKMKKLNDQMGQKFLFKKCASQGPTDSPGLTNMGPFIHLSFFSNAQNIWFFSTSQDIVLPSSSQTSHSLQTLKTSKPFSSQTIVFSSFLPLSLTSFVQPQKQIHLLFRLISFSISRNHHFLLSKCL